MDRAVGREYQLDGERAIGGVGKAKRRSNQVVGCCRSLAPCCNNQAMCAMFAPARSGLRNRRLATHGRGIPMQCSACVFHVPELPVATSDPLDILCSSGLDVGWRQLATRWASSLSEPHSASLTPQVGLRGSQVHNAAATARIHEPSQPAAAAAAAATAHAHRLRPCVQDPGERSHACRGAGV